MLNYSAISQQLLFKKKPKIRYKQATRAMNRFLLFTILTIIIQTTTTIVSAQSYNYNYCGSTWTNANTNCGTSCPLGSDAECPGSETCYADCTNCPAVPIPAPPPP